MAKIAGIGGALGNLLVGIDKAFFGFTDVIQAVVDGAHQARQQLDDFKKFDFDPKFKTRVILVPAAVDGFNDLWETIRFDLRDKFDKIVSDVEGTLEAVKHLPPRGPGEPILQHTALIISIVHATNEKIAEIVREILDLTRTIDSIKKRIETLDDLFLSQSNPRKNVEGFKLRLGHLHEDI